MQRVFSGAAAETATEHDVVDSPDLTPGESFFPLKSRGSPGLRNSVIDDSPRGFTPSEIAAANQRHDRHYGFTFAFPTTYTNLLRFPESIVGDLDWQNPKDFSVIGRTPAQANPCHNGSVARSTIGMDTCCPAPNHPAPERSRKQKQSGEGKPMP